MAAGQVRFRYRHMAFLGPESIAAAEASECAAEQGRFWDFHDRLFAEQQGRDRGAYSTANLKGFAADLRLDSQAFNSCVDSGAAAARVKAETEEGRQKGVSRTPTLFVNGRKLEGVPSYEELLRTIQTALVPAPSTAR